MSFSLDGPKCDDTCAVQQLIQQQPIPKQAELKRLQLEQLQKQYINYERELQQRAELQQYRLQTDFSTNLMASSANFGISSNPSMDARTGVCASTGIGAPGAPEIPKGGFPRGMVAAPMT